MLVPGLVAAAAASPTRTIARTLARLPLQWLPAQWKRHASSDTSLHDLRASIKQQDTDSAVRIYADLRKKWISQTELRMDDLRSLHILLRRSATQRPPESTLSLDDEKRRRALLVIVIQTIDDMQSLGLRVGATEIAAALFACNQIGHYSAAIDRWRAAISQLNTAEEEDKTCSLGLLRVRHLFPQTHIYALTAAVALKSVGAVREVYHSAVRLMDLPPAAFFWALFPAYSEPLPTALVYSSSGSDRAWDCSRLGSAFLELVQTDATRWAANDTKLHSRIVQALLRALLTEGHVHKATRLYDTVVAKKHLMTSWILCEMVAGLCRRSLLDDAHSVLCNAAQTNRTIHAWNTYLDGVASSMRRTQYSASRKRQQRHENRAPLSVLKRIQTCIDWLEQSDGVKPDLATRSIWLRACFRATEWKRAYTYFRTHYDDMRNDIVCWDITIRGLFESGDIEAQKEGWRL
ncbi:hypothetical protein IWW38_002850, partial [Coemansia aciculifera]